jgi:hypothetical protein
MTNIEREREILEELASLKFKGPDGVSLPMVPTALPLVGPIKGIAAVMAGERMLGDMMEEFQVELNKEGLNEYSVAFNALVDAKYRVKLYQQWTKDAQQNISEIKEVRDNFKAQSLSSKSLSEYDKKQAPVIKELNVNIRKYKSECAKLEKIAKKAEVEFNKIKNINPNLLDKAVEKSLSQEAGQMSAVQEQLKEIGKDSLSEASVLDRKSLESQQAALKSAQGAGATDQKAGIKEQTFLRHTTENISTVIKNALIQYDKQDMKVGSELVFVRKALEENFKEWRNILDLETFIKLSREELRGAITSPSAALPTKVVAEAAAGSNISAPDGISSPVMEVAPPGVVPQGKEEALLADLGIVEQGSKVAVSLRAEATAPGKQDLDATTADTTVTPAAVKATVTGNPTAPATSIEGKRMQWPKSPPPLPPAAVAKDKDELPLQAEEQKQEQASPAVQTEAAVSATNIVELAMQPVAVPKDYVGDLGKEGSMMYHLRFGYRTASQDIPRDEYIKLLRDKEPQLYQLAVDRAKEGKGGGGKSTLGEWWSAVKKMSPGSIAMTIGAGLGLTVRGLKGYGKLITSLGELRREGAVRKDIQLALSYVEGLRNNPELLKNYPKSPSGAIPVSQNAVELALKPILEIIHQDLKAVGANDLAALRQKYNGTPTEIFNRLRDAYSKGHPIQGAAVTATAIIPPPATQSPGQESVILRDLPQRPPLATVNQNVATPTASPVSAAAVPPAPPLARPGEEVKFVMPSSPASPAAGLPETAASHSVAENKAAAAADTTLPRSPSAGAVKQDKESLEVVEFVDLDKDFRAAVAELDRLSEEEKKPPEPDAPKDAFDRLDRILEENQQAAESSIPMIDVERYVAKKEDVQEVKSESQKAQEEEYVQGLMKESQEEAKVGEKQPEVIPSAAEADAYVKSLVEEHKAGTKKGKDNIIQQAVPPAKANSVPATHLVAVAKKQTISVVMTVQAGQKESVERLFAGVTHPEIQKWPIDTKAAKHVLVKFSCSKEEGAILASKLAKLDPAPKVSDSSNPEFRSIFNTEVKKASESKQNQAPANEGLNQDSGRDSSPKK